jgi:ADP-heptose:LPS heptosyltransferase
MIVSSGVMRAIARSPSTITMDVLASPANATILDVNDYVADVVVFDKKSLSSYLRTAIRLRRARYDAVIDCMVSAPTVTTLLLILASGARHRIGIAGRGNDAAFNVRVPSTASPDAHMVDRLADLARPFGVPLDSRARQPVLQITTEERARADAVWGTPAARRVLINVSAGTSERVWGEDKYVAVMQHVRDREPTTRFIIIAAPLERERGERVARAGGGTFVPTPMMRGALALVATADFVLTPDTSIAHAASAFRRPAVAMYVRNKAKPWGLYGSMGRNVEHSEPTLETLPVERVTDAIDEMMSRSYASDASPEAIERSWTAARRVARRDRLQRERE